MSHEIRTPMNGVTGTALANWKTMRQGTWSGSLAQAGTRDLDAQAREALARLDEKLYAIWNLGDNVLLAWSRSPDKLLVLSVRHYAIPESIHAGSDDDGARHDAPRIIGELLSGPKYLEPDAFARACTALNCEPAILGVDTPIGNEGFATLISDMVRCYGVSLVRDRAVVLIDAVRFSLQTPLIQMAMLNSLAYSVNSAYGQLLSKDIRIDFARTTTGDGFYIWNRATTLKANAELYKLVMMLLADNAVAQRKARSAWVPRLRAAFHVGEHYEFHQVEGLNPTNFSYIVGQVTVDLSRLVDRALSGQILLGDFVTRSGNGGGGEHTLQFVANAAATLDQLNGLEISGGRIGKIRCYVTGREVGGGRYVANRYQLRDKHGTVRAVYNAKINIHREEAEPIFLGLRTRDLSGFDASLVEGDA